MKIKLPKNFNNVSVFTAEVDMTGISTDDVTWDADDLENAVSAICENSGIEIINVTVGQDNNGDFTFATVTINQD